MRAPIPTIRALLAAAVLAISGCAAPPPTPTLPPTAPPAPTATSAPAPTTAPSTAPQSAQATLAPVKPPDPTKPAAAPSTNTPAPPTNTPPPPTNTSVQPTNTAVVTSVPLNRAKEVAGKSTTVYGPVLGTRYAPSSNGSPTFLNLGRDFPDNSRFTIVIWGRNRGNFQGAPEATYRGKEVCIEGVVELFQDIPQIEAARPAQIAVR